MNLIVNAPHFDAFFEMMMTKWINNKAAKIVCTNKQRQPMMMRSIVKNVSKNTGGFDSQSPQQQKRNPQILKLN